MTSIPTPDWLISDTHFYHGNIRKYYPWRQDWSEGTSDMNRNLIAAWNTVVSPTDVVLHLGDFAFANRTKTKALRDKLNGTIILVRGNHDLNTKALKDVGFDDVYVTVDFTYLNKTYVVRHSPHDFTLDDTKRASVLLHGHLHGSGTYTMSIPEVNAAVKSRRCIDLSLDAIRSTRPVTMEEVKELHGN